MKKAMRWVLDHPVCGLLLDPGLRKTSITLGAFKVLRKKGLVERMLVIAPVKVAHRVWPAEVRKWLDFNDMNVVVLHGKNKTEEQLARDDVDIFVINPEGLEWLFPRFEVPAKQKGESPAEYRARKATLAAKVRADQKRRRKLLFTPGGVMLTVDESTKFKNSSSSRYKYLKDVLPLFARRLILTGTIRPNKLMDLFGQIYIIDLGRSLGTYITQFRKKYFVPSGFGGYDWELRDDKAEGEIYKAVKPYLLRFDAEDFIDLPELIENDIVMDLPEKVRVYYDELEQDLITILDSGSSIEAPTGGAAMMKCEQVCNGAVYKAHQGDGTIRKPTDFIELHDEKLEELAEFLESRQGQPTLVTYQFKHDLVRIRRHLKGMFPRLEKQWGELPCISSAGTKLGQKMEDAWNANEMEVCFGQPQSIAHGLNMQGGNADSIVMFSPIYDWEIYRQLVARLRRSGNTAKHVIVTRFVMRNTVDRLKVIALARKGREQVSFNEAMKRYKSERKS